MDKVKPEVCICCAQWRRISSHYSRPGQQTQLPTWNRN